MLRHWLLDPQVTFLNHGSFGACPVPVLAAQAEWRARMEREPVRFLARELEGHLDAARGALGAFFGAAPADLVFVTNATTGVNTVLRSLEPTIQPTHELLTDDHEYNATLNALQALADRRGARVILAHVPFPATSPDQVHAAIMDRVTPRTRLALLSHVTSATALILPIERLVADLQGRGVDVLVDGAHAPGMVPLDLDRLGAAYYTGNGHKWLCGPKGSGFLHVRADRQAAIRPLVISHGANAPLGGRSRFQVEADWTGTSDPSAVLSLPAAIDFLAGLHPDGWPGVMAANHALAMDGRAVVAAALGDASPGVDALHGSMAALIVPEDHPPLVEPAGTGPGVSLPDDPLRAHLCTEHAIEVPVSAWPPVPSRGPARRVLRISAQRYNDRADYERLAAALAATRG